MYKILLKNGYFIEIDSLNYTLKQKYIGKTKDGEPKESEKNCGYFGNICQAIREYLKLCQIDALDGYALELSEYVGKIETINKNSIKGLEKVLKDFPIK